MSVQRQNIIFCSDLDNVFVVHTTKQLSHICISLIDIEMSIMNLSDKFILE